MTALAVPSSGDLAIDLANVAKTYGGRIRALRDIQMRVHHGEIFGLLGPNGAGKSTLVKILMTVIRPTRCEGTLLSRPVGDKQTLARVGYLPEHHRFPDYLTAEQVLDFFGALGRLPREVRRRRTPELLELVGMGEWSRKPIRSFSKGMRQRIGIAQALINDPDIVLLDEPTDGVDPVGRRDIRAILTRLKDQRKTVFLNSHLLSELEMVCDRVAILVQGVVSRQGTIDELTRDKQRYEIELAADPETAAGTLRAALPAGLQEGAGPLPPSPQPHAPDAVPGAQPLARRTILRGTLPTGEWVEVVRSTLRIGTTDPGAIQPLLDAIRQRGGTIRSVRPIRPSLEDLFMEAVTDPTTGEVLRPGAEQNGNRQAGAAR